jgi:hypothetical protein
MSNESGKEEELGVEGVFIVELRTASEMRAVWGR